MMKKQLNNLKKQLKIYLIINESYIRNFSDLLKIQFLLANGVFVCQIRFKTWDYKKCVYYGTIIKKICFFYNVIFIVNDDLRLAMELNSDGLHIGQDDLNYNYCRKIIGDKKIIGLSVSNKNELILANKLMPDYLGIGTIYPTKSKTNIKIFNDLNIIMKINKIPFVFIGGLNNENIKCLQQYQPDGYAFISFLLDNPNNIFKLK